MADKAFAPYTQAAAVVNKDGSVVRSKAVTEVKKVGKGDYRIIVDADIPLGRAVPIATLNRSAHWGSEIYVKTTDTSGSDHTFQVLTGVDGAASDQPFHVIVP
ncbi:hypothetical protein ACFVFH_05385 [Streptomyces sp. NPDC057697]|uniref:hypothetical protein n=1 Tax=Streptomyces sp. NPDC057697 TaxID=3346219 RepID=UPI0036909A3B